MVLGDTNDLHRSSCSAYPARSLEQQELSGDCSSAHSCRGLRHRVWGHQTDREDDEEIAAAAVSIRLARSKAVPLGAALLRLWPSIGSRADREKRRGALPRE